MTTVGRNRLPASEIGELTQQATADAQEFRPLGTRFLTRVFVVFAALAWLLGQVLGRPGDYYDR